MFGIDSKAATFRDDFDFKIVIFSFLDGDDTRSLSYGVYISHLFHILRLCSDVSGFNHTNNILIAKLLNKLIDIITYVKHFLNFVSDTPICKLIGKLFCIRTY